ncbi:MAG: sugar phosphate isomerase/epimerase [Armatimonadetes bacterium]|nr:sugar phosphate isomerase/epimerase [Armatimonadota bacterium]
MFRLGIITDEISNDFTDALNCMVEWAVPYAEIRGVNGKNVSDLSPEEMRQAKAALDERGLKACGIASPFFKCELSGGAAQDTGALHLAQDRTLDEQRDVLQRCIRAAHTFEVPTIRVFAFWRRGETTPEIVERIIELFHEPLRTAKEAGVTLLLENEHDCYMSTGEETAILLNALAPEGLRCVWDPGNAYRAGETPYPNGYEALKPFITHVHLKDLHVSEDGGYHWVPIGEGDIDYEGHLNALNRDGYSGVISLETHYIPEGGTPAEGSAAALSGLRTIIGRLK